MSNVSGEVAGPVDAKSRSSFILRQDMYSKKGFLVRLIMQIRVW